MLLFMKNICPKHPKYRGKKKPVSLCPDCLILYFQISNKPRIGVLPSKVIKDKTKYTRKLKHKKLDKL